MYFLLIYSLIVTGLIGSSMLLPNSAETDGSETSQYLEIMAKLDEYDRGDISIEDISSRELAIVASYQFEFATVERALVGILAGIKSISFLQLFNPLNYLMGVEITVRTGPRRPSKHITYVDEVLADEIGLDQHEIPEVERIIDYYKIELDQINLNNATVSTLGDNKFVIEIPETREQGAEVRNKLIKEILTVIGKEKFIKFLEHNRNLVEYFKNFGQSARTLEFEITTDTYRDYSNGEIKTVEYVVINDEYEDYYIRNRSIMPMDYLESDPEYSEYSGIVNLIENHRKLQTKPEE